MAEVNIIFSSGLNNLRVLGEVIAKAQYNFPGYIV
jgi:hypothetical protein